MPNAIVTGAASGIGAAVRRQLESDGFEVVGIDLRDSEIIADLSTADGRAGAVEQAKKACGERLDRLVCCAGVGSNVRPASLVAKIDYFGSVDVFDGLFEPLTRGDEPACTVVVSNSAQMAPIEDSPFVAALLDHDEAEAARIIDEMDSPIVAYMGAKHALGRAIRRRVRTWGDARVRLNGVCPGPVRTPLLEGTLADPVTRKSIESIDIPIGRWGQPEDVARLIGFLGSPAASWIHGSIVFIDGGNDAEIRPDRY